MPPGDLRDRRRELARLLGHRDSGHGALTPRIPGPGGRSRGAGSPPLRPPPCCRRSLASVRPGGRRPRSGPVLHQRARAEQAHARLRGPPHQRRDRELRHRRRGRRRPPVGEQLRGAAAQQPRGLGLAAQPAQFEPLARGRRPRPRGRPARAAPRPPSRSSRARGRACSSARASRRAARPRAGPRAPRRRSRKTSHSSAAADGRRSRAPRSRASACRPPAPIAPVGPRRVRVGANREVDPVGELGARGPDLVARHDEALALAPRARCAAPRGRSPASGSEKPWQNSSRPPAISGSRRSLSSSEAWPSSTLPIVLTDRR